MFVLPAIGAISILTFQQSFGLISVSSVFSPAVDCSFQISSGLEGYNAPGRDKNFLPSLGIATHTFRFQSDAEHTESV